MTIAAWAPRRARSRRLATRGVLGAALAVLVVGAALAGTPARASAESGEAAGAETVTTVLQPGWNMVGWLGPEAPVTDLFEAIPALERVSAWDAAEQRYRWRARHIIPRYALEVVEPGMGLWLELGGDLPFQWTRPASAISVLLSLQAGRNLVGWAGRDETAIEEATSRFGDSLARTWQWDAKTQAYRQYRPGAARSSNAIAELDHGDGLFVELTADARWWQPGRAPAPVVFLGDVPDERQAEIRGWLEDTRAVFAERWGVQAPFASYVGDLESLTETYVQVRGGPPPENLCANAGSGAVFARVECIFAGTYPHEYFHILQQSLSARRRGRGPAWMIEGSASWAAAVYVGVTSDELTLSEQLDRQLGNDISALIGLTPPALEEIEEYDAFLSPGTPGYHLGFVAADWLVDHSSEEAVLGFFRTLSGDGTWEEAFESAFGIGSSDFYEEFEAYRNAVAPPLPHITDDSEEPVLVLLGEMSPEEAAAVRATFEQVQTFFSERFAAGAADHTVYVGGGEALAEVHLRVYGTELPEDFCSRARVGVVATIDKACRDAPPHYIDRYHWDTIRERLAPWAALREVPDGHDRRGPRWLLLATDSYLEEASQVEAGRATWGAIRRGQIVRASRLAQRLSSLETYDDATAAGYWRARALSFLAGEWLAARAGDPAIVEYYRALPSSASWQEAFEAAFGLSVTDFDSAFEVYRNAVAPPLPHITDDSEEPVLVLLGEMPPEEAAAVRATFAQVQTFFSERFAAGAADHTVYVGGGEALAEVHLRVYGTELPEDFCSRVRVGVVATIDTTCRDAPPHHIDRYHWDAIRERLAPWAALPEVPDGHDRRGPRWLLLATDSYLEEAYQVEAGRATWGEIRRGQIVRASRLPQRLSSIETYDDATAAGYWDARALAFLAGEWLAARAGDPAIVEYYRALPSSANWQEGFEAAFGLSVADFDSAFEAYRTAVAPPLPHLTDDSEEPVLVLVGHVWQHEQATVRARFALVRSFFSERFAAPVHHTVYVGRGEALAEVYRRLVGAEPSGNFCALEVGVFVIRSMNCSVPLDRYSWWGIRQRLAPPSSLPELPDGYGPWGPRWLILATESYLEDAYQVEAGRATWGEIRRDEIARARRLTRRLITIERTDDVTAAGYWEARGLALLAGEWLAARAGDPAIVQYYRALPSSANWQEAFEAAFGLSVAAFDSAFEAYRAEVAPPLR